MQISLDQPTFLTSLTEEKPANNQTDSSASGDDFMDFSSTMLNQSSDANATSTPSSATPVSSDETQASANDELTPEDLTNLLLGMGYLAETTPKETPTEVPDIQDTRLLNEQPMDLSKATMNLETSGPLVATQQTMINEVDRQEKSMMDTSLPSLALSKPSTALTATPMPLETPMMATTTPALDLKADKKPLDLSKDVKELTKPSDLLIKQALSMDDKLTSTFTPTTKPNTAPTFNTDNTPDQKVLMSFQQLGEWLQTKVNAEPALMPKPNAPATETTFAMLQSQMAAGGAATPAKAAWEAKVEMNQSMSNAELNLTTYHANIKIYPPELGKVTAKMRMDKNEANLEITAENKQVKAILQGHLNTLREQFSQSNITLNKIDIILADNKESGTANPNGRGEKEETQEHFQAETADAKATPPKTSKKTSNNVVDAYV